MNFNNAGRSLHFERSRSLGFTLMELMVVLFILGLMSAVAMPTFLRSYQENQAKQTTAQLSQLLRFAHQDAIFKRRIRMVGIDFETHSYFIRRETRSGHWDSELLRWQQTPLPDGFEFESIYFPKREEEEDSDIAYIMFRPDGSADQVKLTIIRIDDEDRLMKRYVLRVNGVTGHVKVREKKDDIGDYYY